MIDFKALRRRLERAKYRRAMRREFRQGNFARAARYAYRFATA